jgi:hypothetical protein
MSPLILRVSASGKPLAWLPWQEAVLLYARDAVIWAVGEDALRVRGGINRVTGLRSYIDVQPVIAARGGVSKKHEVRTIPPLTNRQLFRRDRHVCLYCLKEFSERWLTRDHVIPVSRGGLNVWTNVVTACQACNQAKADRTPEEAGMRLHAIPYAPNYAEWLILKNRKMMSDQMEFLQAHCPKDSPWRLS